ncbi:MAG: TonB-dependent receptor, partial [Pseudomonadales bacterium]
ELQLFWSVGDNWTATSGVIWYDELRKQDYSLRNAIDRFTQPAEYGVFDDVIPFALPGIPAGFVSINDLLGFSPNHVRLHQAPLGSQILGMWEGDDRGDYYHHQNTVRNESTALYTQGTYTFNDEFALVLGARYAKDKKYAHEVRGGYFELGPSTLGFADGILTFMPGMGFLSVTGVPTFGIPPAPGLTSLALYNIAMGNGSYNPFDPRIVVPTCEWDATTCSTPLRLSGVPYSFSSTIEGEDEWSDTNFRVNLDWTPTDDILMYFSVTTGYRAGGFSLGVVDARLTDAVTGNLTPVTYDAEEVISYEIGYKGLHVDNTLQLNMSLYTYKYDNYQDEVNAFDQATQNQTRVVQNADKATNTGFEIEALWLATDALTLGGNYSYTDTAYDSDYFVGISDDPDLPASLFGNAESDPALFVRNAKGSPLKKIPEH